MNSAHVFFKEGKLYLIPELPIKPKHIDIFSKSSTDKFYEYEKKLAEAKANALPVVNPELVNEFIQQRAIDIERLYEWPGTWEAVTEQIKHEDGSKAFNQDGVWFEDVKYAKLIAPQQPQADKTDNELIAEFDGWSISNIDEFGRESIYRFAKRDKPWKFVDVDEIKYHSSWDWLMPVVEKISLMKWEFETESVDHEAEPDNEGSLPIIRTKEYDFHYPRTFGMIERDTKQFMFRFNPGSLFIEDRLIDAAYKAVVEFIKWYNAQPKHL